MNESTGMLDLIDTAWGIIANVSESDWSRQTPEWQTAAVRWRDQVIDLMAALKSSLDAHPESVMAREAPRMLTDEEREARNRLARIANAHTIRPIMLDGSPLGPDAAILVALIDRLTATTPSTTETDDEKARIAEGGKADAE